jgi:adenylosuccinate synthase
VVKEKGGLLWPPFIPKEDVMSRRAFVVTGLGYGDECKGSTTHWLCRHAYGAHTVIRTGAAQAFHRVVCADGREHIHAQFGSGTLRGSATHLSRNMVIEPHGILKEGESLKYKCGINGIFEMLTIHEDALVITPFQAIANRLRELLRGSARHGSVGIGVGETVLDAEVLGEGAILAKDLGKPALREKLEAIRLRKLSEFEDFADRASSVPSDIKEKVRSEFANLEDPDTVQWALERFSELVRRVKIVDTEFVAKNILGGEGTVVFEGSQGVLLDRYYGFHPYTTKVRTIPETALEIIRECNYDGEVKSLGVLRAYHTRHGRGPFVTESPKLTKLLPDAANTEHPWQGGFRVGAFDLVAAKYAIDVCGKKALDGLVLTCLDRISDLGYWPICEDYTLAGEDMPDALFRNNVSNAISSIKVRRGRNNTQLERQKRLGELLQKCSPNIRRFKNKGDRTNAVADVCMYLLKAKLGVPVVAVSCGPTEKDKYIVYGK